MKKTHGFGGTANQEVTGNFAAADKKKLIIMGVLLIMVAGSYIWSLSFHKSSVHKQDETAAGERPPVEEIFVPEFDFASLNDSIDDSEGGEKRIERAPLEKLIDHTGLLTGLHYDVLDTVNLDGAASEKLMAAPAASRGQAVRLRGTIEALIQRETQKSKTEYFEGRLRLEDGSPAYFAITRLPEDNEGPASPGTFVRINGLFMKGFSAETDNGFEKGPLAVGRNAVFSFESVGDRVTHLPKSMLTLIEDDDAINGKRGDPFSAFWTMLAYARDLEPDTVDWAAAPELTTVTMGEILNDGSKFRGQPFRIPISQNMETRQETIAENPARLETICEGWIGNSAWAAGNGMIKFNAPFPNPELRRKDLITARGFFFRNHLYTPSKGGVAIAPLFVLADIERHIPAEDKITPMITKAVLIGTVGLIGLLAFLLNRDKRKSRALQEDLIRRKRERRARSSGTTASPGQA